MTTQEILDMSERFRLQRQHEAQIDRYYGERERKIKLYEGAGRLCCCYICVKEHAEVYAVGEKPMGVKKGRRTARFFYVVALVFALISFVFAVGNLVWLRSAGVDVRVERDK